MPAEPAAVHNIEKLNPDVKKMPEGMEFVRECGEPAFAWGYSEQKPFRDATVNNLNLWGGRQWQVIDYESSRRYEVRELRPAQCETARRINNQIPMYGRQITSAMYRNLPDFECIPYTRDPEDVAAAKLGNMILKWRDHSDSESAIRQQEIMWMLAAGEVWRKVWWDPKGGLDRRGDVKTEIVDMFHVLIDPMSIGQLTPRWIIEYDIRHIDWVRSTYDKRDIQPEAVVDLFRDLDELARNIPSSRRQQRETPKDLIVVKRFYCPPSEAYPKGHCWVWGHDELLDEHDLQGGVWPFARAQWYPLPARLYAASLVELLAADQRQMNLILSQLQEVANRQLRGDVLTAGGNQPVTEEVVDSTTGRKHIRLPAGVEKWEILKYDLIWQNADRLYQALIQDMHEKAAMSKPSLGHDIGREVRVGELQIAREADLESLSWHMSRYSDEYLVPIQRLKLQLIREFVKDYRLVEYLGDSAADEIPWFTGAELRDTRDVIAVPIPHLTPAMQRQAEMQARELGLLGPYADASDQLSARLTLIRSGLGELEADLARTYGPLDALEGHVAELDQLRQQLSVAETQAALMQAEMMLSQGQQAMGGGQPPSPEEQFAGSMEPTPAMPMEAVMAQGGGQPPVEE